LPGGERCESFGRDLLRRSLLPILQSFSKVVWLAVDVLGGPALPGELYPSNVVENVDP
jgi:hypothetical protein